MHTKIRGGTFTISITHESDISVDGGHTFEKVTSSQDLDTTEALDLIRKLEEFLKSNSKPLIQ